MAPKLKSAAPGALKQGKLSFNSAKRGASATSAAKGKVGASTKSGISPIPSPGTKPATATIVTEDVEMGENEKEKPEKRRESSESIRSAPSVGGRSMSTSSISSYSTRADTAYESDKSGYSASVNAAPVEERSAKRLKTNAGPVPKPRASEPFTKAAPVSQQTEGVDLAVLEKSGKLTKAWNQARGKNGFIALGMSGNDS